jgi:hypothetical protein
MCPYYLDGDWESLQLPLRGSDDSLAVSLDFSLEILLLQSEDRSLHLDTQFHWLLCSFQGPQRGGAATGGLGRETPSRRRRAGLSKLNSTRSIN